MSPEDDALARSEIAAELVGDEKLLWSGRPAQGPLFRTRDFVEGLFGLMYAWAVLGYTKAGTDRVPLFFFFVLAPFAVIALYLLGGRILWEAWRRSSIFYGVTDSRAIIVQRRWPTSVKSIGLFEEPNVQIQEWRDGRGIIRFGLERSIMQPPPNGFWTGSSVFENVADARSVYRTILTVRTLGG